MVTDLSAVYNVYAASLEPCARTLRATLTEQRATCDFSLFHTSSVRIYSTVHLTTSLYERGSPVAQAGSHEDCCLATSLPHSYHSQAAFCGIKAHSVMQIFEAALMSGKVALIQRQTGSEMPCRWHTTLILTVKLLLRYKSSLISATKQIAFK